MLDQPGRLISDTTLDSGISFRRVSAEAFAADIFGFDFETLRDDQVRDVRSIWLRTGVVRFRGYDITDEQHMRSPRSLERSSGTRAS